MILDSQQSDQESLALANLIALLDENDLTESSDSEDPSYLMDSDHLPESVDYISTSSITDEVSITPTIVPAPDSLTKFKKKSTLYPSPSSNPNTSAFLKLVTADIENMKFFHRSKSNFDRDEREALDTLAHDHGIFIKPSDKGSNVVVMDNTQYIEMCQNLLKNREWYHPIGWSSLDRFAHEFYDLVDTAFHHNIITKEIWEFVRTDHPKEAIFSALPKLHKNLDKPPGRPIVFGCCNLTENLSRVVDNHLKPIVECQASYTRNTIHFLQAL